MSKDVLIEITRLGSQLNMVARGEGLPQQGTDLGPRDPIDLNEAQLDALRRGSLTEAEVDEVVEKVSQWLFGDGLGFALPPILTHAGVGEIRLVFSVSDQARDLLPDVPLELAVMQGGASPLIINPKVEAFVRLLPRTGLPQTTSLSQNWPLRILLVRSNPIDLGGAVPQAIPVRDAILESGARLWQKLRPGQPMLTNPVQVDVISSEVGIDKVASWDALRERLAEADYHILVYLGHGDPLPGFGGVSSGGALFFEDPGTATGPMSESVSTRQLTPALLDHPVPLVILAGCLTAAEVPAQKQDFVTKNTPQWIRGNQGVAQALVSSESSVQCAVGMQYQIDDKAAKRFLAFFFRSLIEEKPGNVQAAVRRARAELHAKAPHPPYWSAPVLFSTLPPEPLFAYMATPPVVPQDPNEVARQKLMQEFRSGLWSRSSLLPDPKARELILTPLDDVETQLRTSQLMQGPVIMPGRAAAQPDTTTTVPVVLYGNLDVHMLKGRITIGGEGAAVTKIELADGLKQAGYRLLSSAEGQSQVFELERAQANNQPLTDNTTLFTVEVQLGPILPLVYPVGVEVLEVKPEHAIVVGNNAIVVPRE